MDDTVTRSLGLLMFRLPRAYLKVGLGTGGFALWIRASDFGPFKPRPARAMGAEGIDLTVFTSAFDAETAIRRRVNVRIHVTAQHLPAVEAATVDDLGFGLVPEGLRFFRALPAIGPGSGERTDLFVPADAMEGTGPYDIREGIFCKSPESRNVRDGTYPPDARPCHWYLAHRGLELTMSLDRRHLTRWHAVRAGVLALLDSFVIGPAP